MTEYRMLDARVVHGSLQILGVQFLLAPLAPIVSKVQYNERINKMNNTLQEMFANWPKEAPATANELQYTSTDYLSKLLVDDTHLLKIVLSLRTQIIQASQSWGNSLQLDSPQAVEQALTDGNLRLLTKRWLTLSLDKNKRRTVLAFSSDSARTVEKLSRVVPTAETLPACSPNGLYLLLYGGGPDILSKPATQTALIELVKSVPIGDILFRKLEKGPKSTLFSVRQGFGVSDRIKVEFPDPELIKRIKSVWKEKI